MRTTNGRPYMAKIMKTETIARFLCFCLGFSLVLGAEFCYSPLKLYYWNLHFYFIIRRASVQTFRSACLRSELQVCILPCPPPEKSKRSLLNEYKEHFSFQFGNLYNILHTALEFILSVDMPEFNRDLCPQIVSA